MNYNLNLKLRTIGITAIVLAYFTVLGCVESQSEAPKSTENSEIVNTSTQIPPQEITRQSFDEYIKNSELPISENKSLCYGLNMSSDFSRLPPKWARGKLINIRKENDYWLTFEGVNKSGTIKIPLTDVEAIQYKEGKYYKIDMNNICRYNFMMLDSRYPSSIIQTFVKPEELTLTQTHSLKYKLKANNSYIVGTPMTINFTLENLLDENLWVIKWYTPLEGLRGDIFQVKCDGKEIPYEGMMIKRGEPDQDSYIHIVPRGSVSEEVDLSSGYNLPISEDCQVDFKGRIYDIMSDEGKLPRRNDEHEGMDITGKSVAFCVVGSWDGPAGSCETGS